MANMSGTFTLIYYYVPEDGDDQDILNGFAVPKSSDITLGDVRASFPLEGQYHFRFKHMYQKVAVWMDINNDTCKVPVFNGKIIAKATRISWDSQKTAAVQPEQPVAPPPPQSSMNIFAHHEPEQAPKADTQYDLLFHS
jgi:hypothetical protein